MKQTNQRMTVRRFFSLIAALLVLCLAGGLASTGFFVPAVLAVNQVAKVTLPDVKGEAVTMNLTKLPQLSRMYASDGKTVIAQFYDQNRVVVALKDISEPMQKAVVAREDRRFLTHTGIDPQGILRAFIQTYVKHGDTQGGSTLTQQYVKNALFDQATERGDPIEAYHAHEDTIVRKLREMLIAIQLEKTHSKAEILQGYLNIAQFGVRTYGVETAAEHYFSKHARDLNLGEAATIASITKNPANYDPTVNPQNAQTQRNIVLDLMAKFGFANKKDCEAAKKVPMTSMLHVRNVPVGCQVAGNAAFFCDYVTRKILSNKVFGKTEQDRRRLLYQGGLRIYTTLDLTAQNAAWNAVTSQIPVTDPSGVENMLAAVRPGTGEILAMAQNRNYNATASADKYSTAINYTVGQEEGGGTGFGVGSTFKPINFVAWMQTRHKITTPLRTNTSYPIDSFPCARKTHLVWRVHNSEGGTVNPETPLHALNFSHNTTQASMGQIMGLCAVGKAANALGYRNAIQSQSNIMNELNPTMLIGTLNTSPLSMANTYATIAARGKECTPIAITKVIKSDGTQQAVPSAACHQAIDPGIAETTAYAMNLNVTQGVAKMAQLANHRKTFAKTGTNEQLSIASGGFIPQVAAFVITGNAERPTSLAGMTINGRSKATWYGADLAMPTWVQFMNQYCDQAKIPQDNNYGTPDAKYM